MFDLFKKQEQHTFMEYKLTKDNSKQKQYVHELIEVRLKAQRLANELSAIANKNILMQNSLKHLIYLIISLLHLHSAILQ